MKDVTTTTSTRHSRNALVYPKKRPSPHGITKSHKSPVVSTAGAPRPSPRVAKAALQQRHKAAQLLASRRDAGPYLEEEYREEIRRYMHDMETSTASSTQSMDQQPEIRWHMRPCLVDFLVEIHFTFRLRPETLYLTLNIIDRYVSRRVVYIKHYQLVGCAALWIAAKFEDAKERVPTIQDLVHICRDTYEESAFIQMEGHVLSTIQWTLGHPTAEAWLRLMCCSPIPEDIKVQHVARFLMEITLFYREFVKYSPSTIASASLTLARYVCGKPRRYWEETDECLEVIAHLDDRLATHVNDLSETLVKKYSYAFYSKAATVVVQYYLEGGRFRQEVYAALPITPKRSNASNVNTPMSISPSVSDVSDDMPMTPTTPSTPPHCPSDPFTYSSDKENMPSSFEPVLNKLHVEVPDQFLPHDFVTYSRPALHNLNVCSPRVAIVA